MRYKLMRVQGFVVRVATATWRLMAISEHARLF